MTKRARRVNVETRDSRSMSVPGTPIPSMNAATLVGLCVGAGVFLHLYGPGFLSGTHPFWSQSSDADIITALGATMYYIRDAWRFPIFMAENFNLPDGQNILFRCDYIQWCLRLE